MLFIYYQVNHSSTYYLRAQSLMPVALSSVCAYVQGLMYRSILQQWQDSSHLWTCSVLATMNATTFNLNKKASINFTDTLMKSAMNINHRDKKILLSALQIFNPWVSNKHLQYSTICSATLFTSILFKLSNTKNLCWHVYFHTSVVCQVK